MNILRSILIGLLLGGAFGAKVGTYLSLINEISWSLIEVGFLLGAGIGVLCSIVVLFVRSGALNRKDLDVSQAPLLSEAA